MHLDIHSLLNLEELGTTPTPSTAASALEIRATSPDSQSLSSTKTSNENADEILTQLLDSLQADIESKPQKILDINASRRDLLNIHLHMLAGTRAPEGTARRTDQLRHWLEEIGSPTQNQALHHYIRFVATFTLAQAVLLKAWHDRGIRNFKRTDLQNLSWTLKTALDPYQPLDSRGWQFTQQHLYSWYQPSADAQERLWVELQKLNFHDEGPQTFAQMTKRMMQGFGENLKSPLQPVTYDRKFYDALWKVFETRELFPKVNSGAFHSQSSRTRFAYTPTLRDGSFIRASLPSLHWAGMEISTEKLFLTELIQLWWGPSAPPLWNQGLGIECHSRDQLSLNFGNFGNFGQTQAIAANTIQPKACPRSKLSELESCEIAWVQEDATLRVNSPNAASQLQLVLKENLDQSPYLQTLLTAKNSTTTPQTSLGTLQACVALTKLRPGSYLLWIREEPLGLIEGQRALSFMFERSVLVAEWNLSEITHQLPSSDQPFSKYLYLFKRESDLQTRVQHRPVRVSAQGQLRSYIELPQFMHEILNAPFSLGEEGAFESYGEKSGLQAPAPWSIFAQRSTLPQMEWIEHWPASCDQGTLQTLQRLDKNSVHLANVCTVRAIHNTLSPTLAKAVFGFIVTRSNDQDGAIKCYSLPSSSTAPGAMSPNAVTAIPALPEFKSAFIIGVPSESWVAPLQTYLESPWIQQWLEETAEKKNNRWTLSEQLLKWIPVPRALAEFLDQTPDPFSPHLDEEVERLVRLSQTRISQACESFSETKWTSEQQIRIFTRVARILQNHRQEVQQLSTVIRNHGTPCWSQVLKLLPKAELVPVPLHPQVMITGKIPLHTPIFKMDRQKAPLPGVTLYTETGFTQQVLVNAGANQSLIAEILADQIKELGHPTWSEIVQFVRIPKRAELAKESAQDLLLSHHETQAKVKSFQALLYKCQLF